jgi:dihydroorotate dehydrogenase
VRTPSTEVVKILHQHLGAAIPIIGVGGILSGADAQEKQAAGASLIQLYSGLIYQGPKLIAECAAALKS